jgi:hypothetical protein
LLICDDSCIEPGEIPPTVDREMEPMTENLRDSESATKQKNPNRAKVLLE